MRGHAYGGGRFSASLGRSQAVRQRILIPPFGGSIPPAPANTILLKKNNNLEETNGRV
jgi:hypothetical protein